MGRHSEHSLNLPTGQRIGFSLKQRANDPYLFVVFRSPDGRYLERSTGQTKKADAITRAEDLIRKEYDAPKTDRVTWDEAIEKLKAAFKVRNKRETTLTTYLRAVNLVRKMYSPTTGPADISPSMAKTWRDQYAKGTYTRSKKQEATKRGRSAFTVDSKLRTLNALWATWFVEELEICSVNPWADVDPPKLDKIEARVPHEDDIQKFLDWVRDRYDGWKTPLLFFAVKQFAGNRLMDLCALKSTSLQNGQIVFPAGLTKGRKERRVPLDPELYKDLQEIAGPTYLWENHPKELRPILKAKGVPTHRLKDEFDPKRLYFWFENLMVDYCKAFPDRPKLTTHSFRKLAFTQLWRAGVDPRRASIALGCNVETMMEHYVKCDEQAVTDEVFAEILKKRGGTPPVSPQKNPEPGTSKPLENDQVS